MKMKKTDFGVVVFMYAIAGFFYVYSSQLTAESKRYPLFTIALLFGLTTIYLIQMIIAAKNHGVESGVDTVFAGFKPAQFFVSVALTIVYFFMMKYVGFFVATAVFLIASLTYLRVPMIPRVITVVVMIALIYFAFVVFLGVRLPKGILF